MSESNADEIYVGFCLMDTTGASVSEVLPELDACNQYTGKRYSLLLKLNKFMEKVNVVQKIRKRLPN